jgi:RNA polymerase sigma-70 factor (ECF subfamily)
MPSLEPPSGNRGPTAGVWLQLAAPQEVEESGPAPTAGATEIDLRPGWAGADAERLRRIGAGDWVALGQAYDARSRAVRACARRVVGDPTAAEDLVHDAFVTLPAAARRFRAQCSIRTFIISVALNQSRHHVRSAMRRRKATERLATEPHPRSSDPERNTLRQELARALTRALDRLPHDQRVAFVLCEVEQRDSKEVAVLVGARSATVRTRLHHARRKLRCALGTAGVS